MKRASAAVCCTRDRSTALSTVITRGAAPGAPGWTIGGDGAIPHEPATSARTSAAMRRSEVFNNEENIARLPIRPLSSAKQQILPASGPWDEAVDECLIQRRNAPNLYCSSP